MALKFTFSISNPASSVDAFANTSKVTVSLNVRGTAGEYGAVAGKLNIAGTSYSYSGQVVKGSVNTLITKTKTITHEYDGSKVIDIYATLTTDSTHTSGGGTSGISASISSSIVAEKRYTLRKITRKFTVNLYSQGSLYKSLTKTFNTNLTLPTPTRTGYTFLGWDESSAANGPDWKGTYSNNANVNLYAVWQEITATITYNRNGKSTATSDSTAVMYYTKAYNAANGYTPITGYSFKGWATSATGSVVYTAGQRIKDANVIPTNKTVYAVWQGNSYSVSYNANGATSGSPPSSTTAVYGSSFSVATNSGNLEKTGYIFKGWSRTSNKTSPDYEVGKTITWNIASNTVLYATWEPIYVSINYYKKSSINSNYEISYTDRTTIMYQDYTIPTTITVPNIVNYTFSGYWTLSEPNTKIYTEYGISFPAGIVPYDYTDNQLKAEGFWTAGDVLSSVVRTTNLYPVYRDNTKSVISLVSTKYNYIPDDTDENSYYLYISNQSHNINLSAVSENVIVGFIFKTDVGGTGVDIINSGSQTINISLTSVEEDSKTISLNPIYIRRIVNSNLNIAYTYLICRTTGDSEHSGTLIDPENTQYLFSVTNITDSFGKTITPISKIIDPPKIIRDVNAAGDVISFFGSAPDYTESEKLNHPDNELIVNGVIRSLVKEFNYTKFSYGTNCTYYATSGSDSPCAIKMNRIVNLTGAIKNTAVLSTASNIVTIGKVPAGCEPLYEQRIISQGLYQYRFLLKVCTNGDLQIERYSNSSTAADVSLNSWLNITCTYISKQ